MDVADLEVFVFLVAKYDAFACVADHSIHFRIGVVPEGRLRPIRSILLLSKRVVNVHAAERKHGDLL